MAPGSAVDLRSHVEVEGYPASRDRYFLTDVTLYHATLLMLAARYIPGVRLVRRDEIIPNGIAPGMYDRLLMQDMRDSQDTAAVVAERAVGLHVEDPPLHVYVADILPDSKANGVLRVGDMLLSVAGLRISAAGDVMANIKRLAPGVRVPITFRRADRVESRRVATIRTSVGLRLGIMVQARPERAVLPVPVHCSFTNISGSSGGLMLALQIYDALRPGDHRRAARLVAGTGTIMYDGAVGPIEGAEQKLIAAQRAGLHVFLLPQENYRDLTAKYGMRVIPVRSFAQALAALTPAGPER
jgi:Lon-like protease